MPSRTESLAVREDNKGRWKKQDKLKRRLAQAQSTWGFVPRQVDQPPFVSTGIEPPWLELHAVGFLVQSSVGVSRSRVGIVFFPREKLPESLVTDDAGDHAIEALAHWHRTLETGNDEAKSELARCISGCCKAQKFSRDELAPLLQQLLDAGLVRSEFAATARKLVALSQ